MIKIVTDSTVYLKKEMAEKLGVEIVPCVFVSDGNHYSEGYSDCNEDYIDLMMKSKSNSTSHPNPEVYTKIFRKIIQNGDKIIHISMSSRLSGGFSSASIAAKNFNPEDIEVFDSMMIAGSLQLVVESARRLIDSGVEFNKITKALTQTVAGISTVFTVNDISALRKSGRIGFVRESVGNILNLKPVLNLKDGRVFSIGNVQGENKLISRLVEYISPNTKEVIISSMKNSKTANALYYTIKNKFPRMIIKLQKFGPVLGVHIGEGAVGIAFTKKQG